MEIKFRVWCKRTKTIQGSGGWFLLTQGGQLLEHGPLRPIEDAPMEHYEIMQYTGLKDKNGREVYEGDIVELNNCERFVVQWDCFGWALFWRMCNEGWLTSECVVVGNIYENPDLIKGV